MIGPILPIFLTDRPEIIAADLDKLYQDALRAFTRGDGNAILETLGDKPGEPDRLVYIAEGKAAKETYRIITKLMDTWEQK